MLDKGLTPGEIKVLRAYCEKETHADAATSLGISIQTLKNHLGSIYRKAGARKAHSALYRLTMESGYDPLAITSTTRDGSQVISVGTTNGATEAEKGPESPGLDPTEAESASVDKN